jgi:diguanylate cyclase (GGDEF)-like protein
MVNPVTILSSAFCLASMISLLIGIYALYLNPRAASNRLFFALSVTLAVWSFGFTFALSARSLEECLFWRRFSAIGWGVFFAVLLHFFAVFTGHAAMLVKGRFLLLYLPAATVLLGFTYITGLNPQQYNMIPSPMGWINIAANNGWDIFFIVYFFSYTAASFILVWTWIRKEKNKQLKKHAVLMALTFPAVLVAGTVLDIAFNAVFELKLPQVGPILLLCPALAIFYMIKKHGILMPAGFAEDTVLAGGEIRTTIINYFSNAFMAAAFLYIIAMYLFFEGANLGKVLLFSAFLVILGILIQGIHRSKASNKVKGILFGSILALMIPVATLRFVEFGSITVWAFPFVLLIVTLVFKSRFIQVSIAVSILVSQILVWIAKPQVTVTVDAVDYIGRLGLYVIAIWFAYFIKRVFLSKLTENNNQIVSQKLTTEISSEFVSVSEENIHQKINASLHALGSFFGADRVYIYLYDGKQDCFTFAHGWTNKLSAAQRAVAGSFSPLDCRWFIEALSSKMLAVEAQDLEAAHRDELASIVRHPFASLLALPILSKGRTIGCFMLDTADILRKWSNYELNSFRIITNILGDALSKVQQEKDINFMAYYDYLTQLPNRLLFKDRVNQAITDVKPKQKMLAVIFIDLDAFKNVNDTMGHETGDELLVTVAGALRRAIRESDTVCRFGGDEFLVLLNHMDSVVDIVSVTRKILRVFSQPFVLQGQEFFINVSAGVSVYPKDGEDADTLIKNADMAMYKAKDRGKNQFLLCNAVMKDEIAFRIKLTNSLYRALEREELILHYQPQLSVGTNKIIGVEALLRWKHSDMGIIPPVIFVPLAEHTGLINPIGEWVITTACRQCKEWQEKGYPGIRMAVNVSILQLRNPNLISIVDGILESSGLDPEYLELEITESTANREAEYIGNVLDGLKELGVTISIDDFGTEYSSLGRLSQMPIDRIKIDKQFVWGIDKSIKERSVVKGIIDLGHNLGLDVIAEGVENESQLRFLAQNRCDEVQGFFFHRPVAAETIEQILGRQYSMI